MPNRYIRENWIDSASIDQLDPQAERFFLRLILKADDFGRYTANPVALKNTLFPLKEDVRSTDSSRWLAACEKAGLVRCYETPKGRFLEIPKFGQRARATVSKFPPPSDACPTNDGQTSDKGRSSAPEDEDEDEDEDDIRGREVASKSSPHCHDTDDQWLEGLKGNPAYLGIDITVEFGKCTVWCQTNGKKLSRRRFVNWINRIERPINGNHASRVAPTGTRKNFSELSDNTKRRIAELDAGKSDNFLSDDPAWAALGGVEYVAPKPV